MSSIFIYMHVVILDTDKSGLNGDFVEDFITLNIINFTDMSKERG